MSVEEFRSLLPEGARLPEALARLIRYQDDGGDFGTDFELQAADATAWFAGDEEAASHFYCFGTGGDGSLYALWRYNDTLLLSDAPVVFLGSEGTDCQVIASSIEDFLGLLALGIEDLGYAIAAGDLEDVDEDSTRELRAWMLDVFELELSDDPVALISSAQDSHPDLGAWIETWQASQGIDVDED